MNPQQTLHQIALCLLILGSPLAQAAEPADPAVSTQIRNLQQMHKSLPFSTDLHIHAQATPASALIRAKPHRDKALISIDILVSGLADRLVAPLQALGMQAISVSDFLISGHLPVTTLTRVSELPGVKHIRRNGAFTRHGRVRSQGFWAARAGSIGRLFDYFGEGIRIGVMSDSFDCLGGAAADIASGDIPADVTIVQELDYCESGTDEGRALIQVMVDIAPSAQYLFHTGVSGGSAGNAEAIRSLHETHNVDIIVDDFASYYEPMFQDDLTTQAIDEVVAAGTVYVTAAGNAGSNSYEQVFRPVYDPVLDVTVHDFDPGPANDSSQLLVIPRGESLTLVLQWDQPHYSVSGGSGSETDMDVFLIDALSATVVASSATNNIGNDPVEVLQFQNPSSAHNDRFKLVIAQAGGIVPGILKYILPLKFNGSIEQYHTFSSTIAGHSNASGAITVGATHYQKSIVFDNPANEVDSFSSLGGTPIIYSASGERLQDFAIIRRKPDVTAPNGVNTTFYPGEDIEGDNKPNFNGTSASAPHVAAIAALILEANPDLTPGHVKNIIQETARDITRMGADTLAEGFDYRSGYGLIHAEAAVRKAIRTDTSKLITTVASQIQYPLPTLETNTEITPVAGIGGTGGAGGAGTMSLLTMSLLASLLLLSATLQAKHAGAS